MDPLFVLFLNTLPAAVKADPKKFWTKIKGHFVSRIRYFKKSYYFLAAPDQYVPLTEEALKEELVLRGICHGPKVLPSAQLKKHAPKSQSVTELRRAEKEWLQRRLREVLSTAREKNQLDAVGELSGYSPGPIKLNGVRWLIIRGPERIEPKPGNHEPVLQIIRSLLKPKEEEKKEGPTQEDYFLAWLQRVVRLAQAGRYEPTQVVFLAGAPSDGKTLLATELISPLLGGRSTDATSFFVGGTRFNADLGRAELWLVDDMGEAKGFDRQVYNNQLKKVAADPYVRVEPKGVDAVNVPGLFRAVVVLFNLEGKCHLAPELNEDNRDKYLIFHTFPATLPTGSNQYQEIQALVRKGLSAFCYWLEQYQPSSAVLSANRFQVHPYHNPEVVARIQESGAAAQLLPILDRWMRESKRDEWFGPPMELYEDLQNAQSGTAKIISSLFKSVISFGRALSELTYRYPDRFIRTRPRYGTAYRILSETNAKAVEAAAEETFAAGQPRVVDAKFDSDTAK
jgi:hypothetical protein